MMKAGIRPSEVGGKKDEGASAYSGLEDRFAPVEYSFGIQRGKLEAEEEREHRARRIA